MTSNFSTSSIKKLLAPALHFGSSSSPSIAQPVPVSRQVTQAPKRPSDEVSSWKVSQLLGSHAITQSAVQCTYDDQSIQQPLNLDKGKKRARDIDEPVIASNRKARSCQ